jgi:hypothetical protein
VGSRLVGQTGIGSVARQFAFARASYLIRRCPKRAVSCGTHARDSFDQEVTEGTLRSRLSERIGFVNA